MNQYDYQTIAFPVGDIVFKEKGSKFIGFAYSVNNLNEIKFYVEEIKKNHPKATHHCYAYRLGIEGEIYRANDDGEPSGSAGIPIYNQLLSSDLTNILLIVVRYFGGVKLGIGGLVKAYRETAKLTILEAKIMVKELESVLKISFPFEYQNNAFTLLNKYQAKVLNFDSQEFCWIKFSMPNSKRELFLEEMKKFYQVEIVEE